MQRIPLPHTIPPNTLLELASFSLSGHSYAKFFKCLNLNNIINEGKEHPQIKCGFSYPLGKESFKALTKTKIKTVKRKKKSS